MTLVIFILVLSGLVLAHELGHFVTAKLAGVTVKELGIGFPPRLFAVRRKGTDYSLNIIPFGGFVRMVGEEDPSEPGGLARKPRWLRALVIAAGSLVNLALPVLIFTVLFALPTETFIADTYITAVDPGSPAERAGLQADDRIVEVAGRVVQSPQDVVYRTTLYLGSDMKMVVLRDGRRVETAVRPRWDPPEGRGPLGVSISADDVQVVTQSIPVWQAPWHGLQRTGEILVLARNEITRWIIGSAEVQVAGPIGIAQMTGEVAQLGLAPLFEFIALLSLNLGILNLLPLPMLDGGRLAFIGLEALRSGKRISPQREGMVHFVGLVVLMALIIVVSYFDILRLLAGEGVVP